MTVTSLLAQPTEDERLADLASYRILGTAAERELDEIVALAAQICATPIATITLVDADRQWFKAKVGLSLEGTARDIAFCSLTLKERDALVVKDAREDARFLANPLVVGEPFIRFYTGYPLVTSGGSAVGSLAVMDRVPRELSSSQHFALHVLAEQVVKWLELRRTVLQLEAAVAERDQANLELLLVRNQLEFEVDKKSEALIHATCRQVQAETLYTALWETTSDAILILDRQNIIRFANPSVKILFQHEPQELLGRPLAILQPERLRARHQAGMERYLATGQRKLDWRSTEAVALTRDGAEVPVEISFSEIEIEGEIHFVGIFRDITERKVAEQAIYEEKERAQATLRAIADGVVVLDEKGVVTYLNPTAELLTGHSFAEAAGRAHRDVLQLEDGLERPQELLGREFEDADAAPPLVSGAQILRRPDGTAIPVEGSLTQLRDRTGRRAGAVVAFRDVSQWKELTAQLTFQATHDSLTGLANRAELERRLGMALETAPQTGKVHSLLYLDLDQFKVVNDTCGHGAGDEMLRQLGQVLCSHLGGEDTLSRFGGDEFGVLLEDCNSDRALLIAETIRQAIADFPFVWQGHTFNVGVSIGLVCFGDSPMTLGEILSKADEACYLAKDLGRNRVHSYQAGDEELARRHSEMEWVVQIRKALKEGRFTLFAQQIFSLSDESGSPHHEILVRMLAEDGSLVPPMSFIPAAERYNLMPVIDRWVIGAVCRHLGAQIRERPAEPLPQYAINLSGGSVTDAHLASFVQGIFQETGVPGSCICFEITETAAIGNLAHAVRLMQELKAVGCQFSLDDFGSGMSSFAYLKRLPVDFLKIDGSFIRDIADDPVDYAMVKAIHEVGRLMGLRTVAEFVEDDRILAELRKIGVDYGQGYGLAKPVHFL